MSIETRCPNNKCDARFVVTEEQLGKTARCKKCGMRFKISRGLGVPLFGPPGRSPNRPESQQAATAVTQPQEAATQPVQPASMEPAGPDAAVTQAETPVIQTSPAQAEMPEPGVTQAADQAAIDVQAQGEDAAGRQAAEDAVPAEWSVGDVILDTYEVRKLSDSLDYAEGGFGRVYRVHHRGWNMDLAVKSPLADKFQNEQQKQNFIAECETWIELGLHPNIVSCHYVRLLGGIPRVFAEYVEGGSLEDWINDKRLYEDGPVEALKRILDIAIQFAWGLRYAHEKGLVHQDVKPHNVMMTLDSEAKVTDLGLARARAAADEASGAQPGHSMFVPGAGFMTEAYASPEQAAGKPLTRKTDIWSWGLSILEMFTGEVTWPSGTIAATALETYLDAGSEDDSIPAMPGELADLLRHCFQQNPDDRPKDMAEIAGKLEEVYRETNAEDYPREEPKPAELLADGRNNRAVSMIDLGRKEEAEKLYEQALLSDPHHPEATYNRGLLLWRSGRLTDDALIQQMEQTSGSYPRADYLLGLLHLERGDTEAALRFLNEARKRVPDDQTIAAAADSATQLRSASHHPDRVFKGHAGPVSAVAFCSDGRTFFSGSWDYSVRRWDVTTGKCMNVLEGHRKKITALSTSATGNVVVTVGEDRDMRVWAPDARACLHVLTEQDSETRTVSVHPSGRSCVSGSADGHMQAWDLGKGQCIQAWQGHDRDVVDLAFCKGGDVVVSAGSDGTIRRWYWPTGKPFGVCEVHAGQITSMATEAQGRVALIGHLDGAIQLWDLNAGKCLRTLSGHAGMVRSVSLSASGPLALSTALDNTVRVWDTEHGRCLRTIQAESTDMATLSPDESTIIWSEKSKRGVFNWDIHLAYLTLGPAEPFALSRPKISGITYRDEDRARKLKETAESALASGNAREAYDAATAILRIDGHARDSAALEVRAGAGLMGRRTRVHDGWLSRVFAGTEMPVSCVTFSPDARAIVSGAWDGAVRVWDSRGEKPPRIFQDHVGPVSSVAVSMGGLVVVSGGWDGTLRFESPGLQKKLGALIAPQEPVCAMAVSSDHRCAVTGGGSLALANELQANKHDADTLKLIWASLTDAAGPVAAVIHQRRPKSKTDYRIRVWDLLATGKCVHVLEGHTGPVRSVAITRDSRCAISGSEDGTVRAWDLVTGRCATVIAKQGQVFSVALSPDETRVWAAKAWGMVTELDLARGQATREMQPGLRKDGIAVQGDEHATSVAVSSDGRSVAVGYQNGAIRTWNADKGECEVVLQGHVGWVSQLEFSRDSRWLVSAGGDGTVRLWELLSDFDFPAAADWDIGASVFLTLFLASRSRGDAGVTATCGKPVWTQKHVEALTQELQHRGFGWLRPESVRKKLKEMTANWQGPLALPWESAARAKDQRKPHAAIETQETRPAAQEAAKTIPASTSPPAQEKRDEPSKARPTPGRNDPCPCGSGKKYKACCGLPQPKPRPPLQEQIAQQLWAGRLRRASIPSSDAPAFVPGIGHIKRDVLNLLTIEAIGRDKERTIERSSDLKAALGAGIRKVFEEKLAEARICPSCGTRALAHFRVRTGAKPFHMCLRCGFDDREPAAGHTQRDVKGPDGRKICPCGKENPPANTFCVACGKRLPKVALEICPHCGKQTPANMGSCVHCGKESGSD